MACKVAGRSLCGITLDSTAWCRAVLRTCLHNSAEFAPLKALGHMFSVARHIAVANYTMRNGQWNKKQYKGSEIAGKTLGIIGMGRIGKALAGKAEALGMKIIYTDALGKQDNLAYEFMDLDNLLKVSDYVSLHVPYNKDKGALISDREISMMKDGAVIINCARGKVVEIGRAHV